jgi:hypothetical protein
MWLRRDNACIALGDGAVGGWERFWMERGNNVSCKLTNVIPPALNLSKGGAGVVTLVGIIHLRQI